VGGPSALEVDLRRGLSAGFRYGLRSGRESLAGELSIRLPTSHCAVPMGLDLPESYPALPCRARDCPVPLGLLRRVT
jgi:hypothetical protein